MIWLPKGIVDGVRTTTVRDITRPAFRHCSARPPVEFLTFCWDTAGILRADARPIDSELPRFRPARGESSRFNGNHSIAPFGVMM